MMKQSIDCIFKKAKQGNPEAQYDLGLLYYNGEDGLPKDGCEAIKWFRLLTEQGNANGQFGLGMCYLYGRGTEKNIEEAKKWFKECYDKDYWIDFPWDDEKSAVKWFRKLAECGNCVAQYHLGLCYLLGYGVGKNVEEVVKWFEKAAKDECTDAQEELDDIKKNR